MSLPLEFLPVVRDEMDDAYAWYENQQPGLGDRFVAAIELVFQRIARLPKLHSVVFRDVRRALPKRFPFSVLYRVLSDRILVIAVFHDKRDPNEWKVRV